MMTYSGSPKGRTAPTLRTLSIAVTEGLHKRLGDLARAAGMPTETYARLLFEAAYAARSGATGDRDLDHEVAATVLLLGTAMQTSAIATTLGTSEATVKRVQKAWARERRA